MNLKTLLTIILILNILSIGTAFAVDEPPFFTSNQSRQTESISDNEYPFFSTGLMIPEHVQGTFYAVNSDQDDIVTSQLPSTWDWRLHDGVTPVTDQGNCGACYAFAAIGMVESYIKVHTGQTYDLSEEQVKNCMWEATGCLGGTVQWGMNPLITRGVILEKDMPYDPSSGSCTNTIPTLRVTDWKLLSTEKVLDKNTLKKYIYENGPVATSLIVNNWAKEYNGSYVLSPKKDGAGHAVVIVGWNDSKSDENVSGHWIFKNSWSENWGDNGYGLIEYDTANIGTHVSVIGGFEDYDSKIHTLNYDDAGWNDGLGAIGFDCIRGMVIHDNISTEQKVKGIEFWTTGKTNDVDLYLYDGFEPARNKKGYYTGDFGNLLYSVENLKYNEPGYHSVKITDDVFSTTGRIVIVASVENEDCVYFDNKVAPIAIDKKGPSEFERTFVSVGDPKSPWFDWWYDASTMRYMNGQTGKNDVALRLRITGEEIIPCEYILIDTEDYIRSIEIGETVNFITNIIDKYGMPVECNDITWHVSDVTIGSMTDSTFTGKSAGNVTIFATGPCANVESNDIIISVRKASKTYLTDEEFRYQMEKLQKELDSLDDQNTDNLQIIFDALNKSNNVKKVIITPNDMVSMDTFEEVVADFHKQIADMKNKSKSFVDKIVEYILDKFK